MVVSPHRARRHRRDSSPEDRKHSKERHRSGVRRSRSGSRGADRHGVRRRHRRRHDGSGSRAGTPLRDEPDALPTEPRRPPRERPPLPMSLPLPKFAAQLLRTAPPTPRLHPPPAFAPDSPPRPPSVSSSSGGSAPHSPSLEERIRSLDEKYEKWSGTRSLVEPPDRTRLRHRLLDIDINEVKPSEVVRSLLAKRSVFDEDSERLEGAVRPTSPSGGSSRMRTLCTTRRFTFAPLSQIQPPLPLDGDAEGEAEGEIAERPADPRLNRPERPPRIERLGKFNESDYRLDERPGPHTPPAPCALTEVPITLTSVTIVKDENCENQSNLSTAFNNDSLIRCKLGIDYDSVSNKEISSRELTPQSDETINKSCKLEAMNKLEENKPTIGFSSSKIDSIESDTRFVMDMLLKRVERSQDLNTVPIVENELNTNINETVINTKNLEADNLSISRKEDIPANTQINIEQTTLKQTEKDSTHVVTYTNDLDSMKIQNELSDTCKDLLRTCEKNGNDKCAYNMLEMFHISKFEKENIQFEKPVEKDSTNNTKSHLTIDKQSDSDKNTEDSLKYDREKLRHSTKDHLENNVITNEKEKTKNMRNEKYYEKDRKQRDDTEKSHNHVSDKVKVERLKDKLERDVKNKTFVDRQSRENHQKKEKSEKDKRKDSFDSDLLRSKKEDKHKHDRSKKDPEIKREVKKESDLHKTRKSSRDESSREIARKDSTDSSTSRTSHESSKTKELDSIDNKDEFKMKSRHSDGFLKHGSDKDFFLKSIEPKLETVNDCVITVKTELKEEIKLENLCKNEVEPFLEHTYKLKDISDKQRHYSLDSPSLDSKRKERLNSCSSLPSTIGHKRRMSSQDSIDSLNDDTKKSKVENKFPERRESKDSRGVDKSKSAKFSKGHFAKLIESKTKDDKKNQVKTPDQTSIDLKEIEIKHQKHTDNVKTLKKSPKDEVERHRTELQPDGLHNDLDFLATLELRSSEEDERQKALRKEMKEKKRIQQLQQIQELQMQQDALQQAELMGKLKDEKKQRIDDKKKEAVRDKRLSTDRKSRDQDNNKRKNRKTNQTSDSSDSDEPKKHSIFDIVDDEPTYISMYDKVKARSCKNMQKQEEEKRQEKIKAKFSQLKQSRAKREEKKRSSWDEDSDSDQDRKKAQKSSIENSSDDENILSQCKKQDKSNISYPDYDANKSDDYYTIMCNDVDMKNKIHSRKNSRTRIMSDTSDEEITKRNIIKSPNSYFKDIKKGINNSHFLDDSKSENIHFKDTDCHMIKRKSLFNLFGKSDSDEIKVKSSFVHENDCKSSYVKSISNEFSSESESLLPARNLGEMRKKHKKKVKKHKSDYSDDEIRKDLENSDTSAFETENQLKLIEKQRRHSSKKEKRRDKIRESIDVDECRDEKNKKKDKNVSVFNNFDFNVETLSNNVKKDGKMEDIFGPLSDDSDKECRGFQNKTEFSVRDYEANYSPPKNDLCKSSEIKLRDKEDIKRKKDKKRKEKRMSKEDDNSLDVDAVSKAIEARLFADIDESNVKITSNAESSNKVGSTSYRHDQDDFTRNEFNKHEKSKKEFKEKKKKKKRNKEDRQFRKVHDFYNQGNSEKHNILNVNEKHGPESSLKTLFLDIPLPKENTENDTMTKIEDNIMHMESPSLPRLTDSPPIARKIDDKSKSEIPSPIENTIETKTDDINKEVFLEISVDSQFQTTTKNTEEIFLDSVKTTSSSDKQHIESLVISYEKDVSENVSVTIPDYESDQSKMVEKKMENIEVQTCKIEKKMEEKPRAIISQEETEDAVAALLGESFGGKEDAFSGYDEIETNSPNQNEIEHTAIENNNIREEDAEEMRQAVQNLNACEMEIKPETPVSDNDLLLIDTDTEEPDETGHDAIERLPINIIATSPSLTNNTEKIKSSDLSDVIVSKLKQNVPQSIDSEGTDCSTRDTTDVKIHLTKRENVQIISSTATPVITSWALTNNKSLDSHTMNTNTMVNTNAITKRDLIETKSTHITTNIVQIRTPSVPNIHVNNMPRAVVAPSRASTPFQVIGQPLQCRSALPEPTPPTIKIPEPHILYQRSQGIVISPRITNESTLLSPKASPRAESSSSPRLANMTILSGPAQSLNSASPRAGGQVTVVRVPQLPTLGVGGIGSAGTVRALMSPPRPSSVLVPAPPSHFGRLPVAPVLAPISKQVAVANVANVVTSNKNTCHISPQTHHQKVAIGDCGTLEHRTDAATEHSKIILSPTTLQRSANPALVTQNRLIMQNTMHVSNVGPALHVNNKVLINTVNHLNEKRDRQNQEQMNHIAFGSTPLIHVAGVNHSSASLIQGSPKSVVCSVQDTNTLNRCKGGPNLIHTYSSQRLIPSSSISNLLQIDSNKGSPPVLSIRSPVLTKVEGPVTSSFSTISPLLIKTTNTTGPLRLNTKIDKNDIDTVSIPIPTIQEKEFKSSENKDEGISISNSNSVKINHLTHSLGSISPKTDQIAKCETDFEELLKDNTNEIKVTNDPEKKLEVNVGKTVTLITPNSPRHNKSNSISIKENLSHISSDMKYSEHSYSQAHTVNFNEKRIDESKILQKSKSILTDGIEQNLIDENIDIDNNSKKEKSDSSTIFKERNIVENKLPVTEDEKSLKLITITKNEDECAQNQSKNIYDNDVRSAKDVNIESVIKKVDSLCNERTNTQDQSESVCESVKNDHTENDANDLVIGSTNIKQSDDSNISNTNCSVIKETVLDLNTSLPKRGGRSCRGKKNEKNKDKVQNRQISKPARGGPAAKRGRGRTKVDKKFKGLVNNNTSTMPGDIYDFHDDSGDEVAASPTKNEARPRLILTIKSPISGHSNVTATSSLTIAQKDQNKPIEKGSKDEKNEEFTSPCLNTRKSRRLLEKDVQRSTVDDVIEDVVKGANVQSKSNKDTVKKRSARQMGIKVNNNLDRMASTEIRKSPRGAKRPRDSLSDASVESGDEKCGKREEGSSDAKIAKPADVATTTSVAPCTNPAPTPPTAAVVTHSVPTPIIKPPKKMISEISAKLGCSFEASTGEGVTHSQTERSLVDTGERREAGDKKVTISGSGANDCGSVGEVGVSRRPPDGVPGPPLAVGAAEPGDARVQSPALPHRTPSLPPTHRPADRATPILGRLV